MRVLPSSLLPEHFGAYRDLHLDPDQRIEIVERVLVLP
jgi:hypothetical protein